MFIINLRYIKPLDTIDRHLPGHRAFLEEQYAKGIFVLSGRKVPRTGGIILARGKSRKELLALLKEDPFVRDGIADYDVAQFTPTLVAEGLEFLKE